MLTINGMRRPKRSASKPKTIAPIHLVARVAAMVSAMSACVLPNSLPMCSKAKVRTKKSNASKVQPRNPARTALCVPLPVAAPSVWPGWAESAMPLCAPLVCARHQAGEHRGANGREHQQHRSESHVPQQHFPGTKQRQINHAATEPPGEQV